MTSEANNFQRETRCLLVRDYFFYRRVRGLTESFTTRCHNNQTYGGLLLCVYERVCSVKEINSWISVVKIRTSVQRMNCKHNSKATALDAAGLSLELFALNSGGPARRQITKVVHFVNKSHTHQIRIRQNVKHDHNLPSIPELRYWIMARKGFFCGALWCHSEVDLMSSLHLFILLSHLCKLLSQLANSFLGYGQKPALWGSQWPLSELTKISSAHFEVQVFTAYVPEYSRPVIVNSWHVKPGTRCFLYGSN